MGLIDDVGPGPVGVDTAAFIYLIEAHPTYVPALRPLFDAADREVLTIVTSTVTLLEMLVVPYRAGNQPLAQRYEALLTRGRGRCVARDRPSASACGCPASRSGGGPHARRPATCSGARRKSAPRS